MGAHADVLSRFRREPASPRSRGFELPVLAPKSHQATEVGQECHTAEFGSFRVAWCRPIGRGNDYTQARLGGWNECESRLTDSGKGPRHLRSAPVVGRNRRGRPCGHSCSGESTAPVLYCTFAERSLETASARQPRAGIPRGARSAGHARRVCGPVNFVTSHRRGLFGMPP